MQAGGEWPPLEARWTVRMLGRMDVGNRSGERPKFRSKSVQALLAYLALNPGRDVSRFLLEETFWPDSDSDKQAQNLRRAVADLRDALEFDVPRGTIIETRRDVVSANPRLIATDATRFLLLTEEGLREGRQDPLKEAVELYGGPLLSPLNNDWVYAYRLEFEERFGQSVETLCRLRIEGGAAQEAVRIARAAVLAAPSREDIHIALIHGYRNAGLEAEALRQYEDLERMMEENWGETPSERAKEARDGTLRSVSAPVPSTRQAPLAVGGDTEPSGGAMTLTSRFYVRRAADGHAEEALDRGESVILVQGPRQVGKSSLLARSLGYVRDKGVAAVHSDFQTIGESQMVDEERLYKTLAHSLATQLKVTLDPHASWSSWLGPNMNLDAILGKLLEQVDGRVCWAIDEADRLFGRAYANDFFGLLRSWHNRRALDPGGPWSKLTLILAYATEAHLFITDLNQSPFNVGVRLPLRDFTRVEVLALADSYGISDGEAIETAFSVTLGHPFLTRRALAFLSQGGTSAELVASCALADGPFGDHLQAVLGVVLQDVQLVEELKRMRAGEPFAGPTTRYRLTAAGLLAMSADCTPTFRVPAYGPFFGQVLN